MRWPNEKTRTKQRKNNDLQEKCEDTNGVIRSRKSKKEQTTQNRLETENAMVKRKSTSDDLLENVEGTNGVMRSHQSKRNIQYNGKKMINNDLQNTTPKNLDAEL